MKTLTETAVLSGTDRQFLSEIKAAVRRQLPTATVLLYGSVARGTQGRDSDYDILVLLDDDLTYEMEDQVRGAVYAVELEHGVVVSMVFCSRARWDIPVVRVSPFRQEVDRDAIAL